jgi:hypothetical protein
MNIDEATRKRTEAEHLILSMVNSFGSSNSSSPGVGIGVSQNDIGKYRLVFHLAGEDDKKILDAFSQKLDMEEPPGIRIIGRAFSLPSDSDMQLVTSIRDRPLRVGSHVSPRGILGGTLGCFVRKISHPSKLFILSCTHVLSSFNNGQVGDIIVQPGGSDLADDQVAELHEFIPLTSGSTSILLDAAIAEVSCKSTLNNISSLHSSIQLRGNYSSNELTSLLEKRVFKVGSVSNKTFGYVKEVNTSIDISYQDSPQSSSYRYQNSIVIESDSSDPKFSRPGDSGSLICDESGYAVGLLIGGNRLGITYALPIEPILERLEIKLVLNET